MARLEDLTRGAAIKGNRRIVSKQLQFVEIDQEGATQSAGYAPYLDYRAVTETDRNPLVSTLESQTWLSGDLEGRIVSHAIETLVPAHLQEVRARREDLAVRTMAAVKDRLTKEITYWDHRANQLKDQELAGKVNAKINSGKARQRADELQARLQKRMLELEQERQISPLPPVAIGGALVVPIGLLIKLSPGADLATDGDAAANRKHIELAAMQAVMQMERQLGFEPNDVSGIKCGYDIESRIPGTGKLRFIEVKGREQEALTVTVSRNEILTALNKPEDFVLAIARIEDGRHDLTYLQKPFRNEPDFTVESITYNIEDLLSIAEHWSPKA